MFMGLGFMATVFLMVDLSMIFWGAYQGGGTITVGDEPWVILLELLIIVPISFMWMLRYLMRDA